MAEINNNTALVFLRAGMEKLSTDPAYAAQSAVHGSGYVEPKTQVAEDIATMWGFAMRLVTNPSPPVSFMKTNPVLAEQADKLLKREGFATEEDIAPIRERLARGGLAYPLCKPTK